MTLTTHVSPDLADSPCSVADCLESAQVMASATVTIDPSIDLPPDVGTVTFGLPICPDHAQLLNRGCTFRGFYSGL